MQTNLAEAERRIEEARRTRAESLDLGDLALSELPLSLGTLRSLKVLYLGRMRLNETGEPEWDGRREPYVFTDLTPLAGLQGLQSLNLAECIGVRDLSVLSGLARLQSLDLSWTRVTDLSVLSGLGGLESLNLSGTRVTDLSALSGLARLESLDLSDTRVTDLSVLSGLAKLESLNLSGTRVTDLSALSGLARLESLDLSWTRVSDLSVLSGLGGLESLDLSGTRVTDLFALSGFAKLESLNLSGTSVMDFSVLSGLAELESLDLSWTRVTDLSALSGLAGLESLDISDTGVTDLSMLSYLAGLQSLKLRHCEGVKDLFALSGLTSLESLDLSNTGVTDFSVLSGLTSLESLDLSDTRVTDFSVLSGLTSLESLDLSGTRVADLSVLSGLTSLESLKLSSTRVTDFSVLSCLVRLQSLNLSRTGVTDLSVLSGLTSLESLDLSSTRVTDLSVLSGLAGLQSLNLQICERVTDLSVLLGLTGLQSLYLFGTRVTDLSVLSGFGRLQSLDLSDMGVTDLSVLSGLAGLQSLNLSGTGVTDLSVLSGLGGLRSLNLSGTGVTDLSMLSSLGGLQSLDLSDTGVTDLTALSGLVGLQSLNLSRTGVTDLSVLSSLCGLQSLDLSETGVTDLSVLSDLAGIQRLSLSRTGVTDLTALSGLAGLQRLYLFGTSVTDLTTLSDLTGLQSLFISGGSVTDLTALSGLAGLQSLYLQGTSVTNLSVLSGLAGLRSLDLHGCRPSPTTKHLRSFADLPNLTELVVDEATGIPREVLSHDGNDNCLPRLRTYFSELDLGSEVENEVKVILLGNGRVGKTQLCRRFRGEPFDYSIPSTHGVQIWREKLQIRTGSEEQAFQVNWWDFGGQDIYHGTHSLFLRSRAVFLILWMPSLENREEYSENGIPMRNQPLAYWLDYVRSLAGEGSPVIVVQSRCDRFADQSRDLPKLDGFGWSQHSFYSAKTDLGREVLEAQLRDAIRYLLERNGALEIGRGRAKVRRQLYEWRAADQVLPPEARQHRTITVEEFQALCDEAGYILSWEHALDYFHHTGVVFYRSDLFSGSIILDQDWALDAVYAVFHRGQAVPWLRDSGRFTREDLAATVWQNYSPEEQRLFLGLMKSCGVCFPCGETPEGESRYVAPDLLPKFEAISNRVYLVWNETPNTPMLRMEYRFFHPAVIRGLMGEIGRRTGDLGEYWKYGLWFKDGRWNAQLLVQFKDTSTDEAPGAGSLLLKAQGRDPLGLLHEIRMVVLRQRIGEEPEELLTLNGTTVARSALFTLSEGRVSDSGKKWIPAAAFASFFEDREYDPEELRADQEKQGMSIDPQPLRPDEKPREVFISYAWGDETPEGKVREEAVEHLVSAFVQDGFNPARDKDRIRPGELISAFIRQLTRADHVVAIVSDKYLRSPYCMYEIYKLWQRCQGDADELAERVIPVVLPEVKIKNVRERLPYLQYWGDEAETLEALVRNPKISPSRESWEEVRLVRQFAQHVDEILVFLQDVLMPRNLEAHFENGFEAVREALRRRVGNGESKDLQSRRDVRK